MRHRSDKFQEFAVRGAASRVFDSTVPTAIFDTNVAIFDTNVLILSAPIGSLGGLTDVNSRFDYRVDVYSDGVLRDSTPILTYDVLPPGLDVFAVPGQTPMPFDLPGNSMTLTNDQASYQANGSLGLLLPHHYNQNGTCAEVVTVTPVLTVPQIPRRRSAPRRTRRTLARTDDRPPSTGAKRSWSSAPAAMPDYTGSMVDVARYFMEFCMTESCGKCIPCRVGTAQMHGLLTRFADKRATTRDLDLLEQLCDLTRNTSLCGLGQSAPNPVLSTLRYFRQEYEVAITATELPVLNGAAAHMNGREG